MKYRNTKKVEYGDVCIVYPVKKFWPFEKGSVTTRPYYVYIRYEHVGDDKDLKLVTHIPDKRSCVINDYLLKRMEYIGNLKLDYSLFRFIVKQDIK